MDIIVKFISNFIMSLNSLELIIFIVSTATFGAVIILYKEKQRGLDGIDDTHLTLEQLKKKYPNQTTRELRYYREMLFDDDEFGY